MLLAGKIRKARAYDIPEFATSGWKIIPSKAFSRTSPEELAKLDPLPEINRKDYKEFLE